jgi:light-independent protochlorophyllide reductase subunit B
VEALELQAYQKKENWGAAETFYRLVRSCVRSKTAATRSVDAPKPIRRPCCNLLGPCGLGFRHRDDVIEVTRLLGLLGIDVAVVAPAGAAPADLARLPEADFNVVLYPEIAETAAAWLERTFQQARTRVVPIGVGATRDFVREVAALAGVDPEPGLAAAGSRLPWYSHSVDSTYLTGKRVFIFGDATHVLAAARIATEEAGFEVVGLGTYTREFARPVRELAARLGIEALISDDYLEVEAQVEALRPDLVLGTQMERHIAKRLGLPCAVISAPVHVQDFPARYAPQMGYEGANVLWDTWVQPLMMGLEEHLLQMFREDFEFHGDAPASHLGTSAAPGAARSSTAEGLPAESPPATAPSAAAVASPAAAPSEWPGESADSGSTVAMPAPQPVTAAPTLALAPALAGSPVWANDAERELGRIPFFVRGKARRNTERYAREQGVGLITVETLYEAKAHFSR